MKACQAMIACAVLYMNDYRFFLQKIGNSHDMIDIEPDFWGYVRSFGNPHQVAVQVSSANPTDAHLSITGAKNDTWPAAVARWS